MGKKPTYEALLKQVKQLEKTVQESNRVAKYLEQERKFSENVLNSLPGIFYLYDEDGNIVRWNNNHEILTGFSAEEISRRKLLDWFNEEEKKYIASRVKETFDLGKSDAEAYLVIKSGEKVPYYFTAMRMIIDNRKYLLGMGTDLSELKKTEDELRKSEEKYREIVEGTDNLVTEVDSEGRFTFVNETALKVFGLNPEECIGQLAFDFIHPNDRKNTQKHFSRWVKDKKPSVTFENRQVSRSGEVRDMLWSINFHFDDTGNITSIKSIARDITERRKAEEALLKAHDELEQRVEERTAELAKANDQLKQEIEERKLAEKEREKLINELQGALMEIKTLRGILPLCSFCKKIRDDKGYWEQVDVYIHKHSQADISHSICPDCAKEHYPDLELFDD